MVEAMFYIASTAFIIACEIETSIKIARFSCFPPKTTDWRQS